MNATLARHWWAIMLRGVIAVLFGVIALAAPGAVLLSLAFLFGVYLMIDGIIGLVGHRCSGRRPRPLGRAAGRRWR